MSKIRLYLGSLLTVLGLVVIIGTPPVSADALQEWWQATFFRAVRVTRAGQTTGWYCLGPAEWTVSGTVGTVTFSEVWRVGDYDQRSDDSGWLTSGELYPAAGTSEYGYRSYCTDDETINKSQTAIQPTGLYGGLVTGNEGWIDSWDLSEDIFGVRSMPKKWTIKGEIDQ